MKTIKEWLEGEKDYSIGLILLMEHSKNRILLQNLSRKSLPDKLEYELRKFYIEDISVALPEDNKQLENDGVVKMGGKSRIDPESLPVHLKQLWDETAESYRLARALHEQIKVMPDAVQRAKGIEQLDGYRKVIRENWGVIDAWVCEQQKGLNNIDIDENRINANRKYLSEGKKAVLALSGATRAKKLGAMQRRIDELLFAGEKFDPQNQKELEELGLTFNG